MNPPNLNLRPGDLAAVWLDGEWVTKEVLHPTEDSIWLVGPLGVGAWDWDLVGPPF